MGVPRKAFGTWVNSQDLKDLARVLYAAMEARREGLLAASSFAVAWVQAVDQIAFWVSVMVSEVEVKEEEVL